MSIAMTTMTPDEIEVTTRLRAVLAAAKYPATYHVARHDIETLEGYFQRLQEEALDRWTAAGQPDEWPERIWQTFAGPHQGLMFKGVELLLA